MANNIRTLKGKYIVSRDFKYYFSSGVNITASGNKAFITFFNEVPAKSEQFEISVSEDGENIAGRDIPPKTHELERIQQCTIEMDIEGAQQIFDFLSGSFKEEK